LQVEEKLLGLIQLQVYINFNYLNLFNIFLALNLLQKAAAELITVMVDGKHIKYHYVLLFI